MEMQSCPLKEGGESTCSYGTIADEKCQEHAVERRSPVLFVYIVASCAALNSCNVGFDIGVNSPAGILLQEDLALSNVQLEAFMGSINLFALLGALLSSRAVDSLGMRASFILSSVIFLVGLLSIVLSPTYELIMIGRVLVGTGVGWSYATTPAYLAEISPKEHRGFFTSWSEIGCNVGILLGFSTSLLFHGDRGGANDDDDDDNVGLTWRLMFATGLVFPVGIIASTFAVLPESPRWLVRRRRLSDARSVLRRLHPPSHDVSSVVEDIERDIACERDESAGGSGGGGGGWSFLIDPSPAIRTMLSLGLFVAVSQQFCGIDAIQYYLVFIMDASGIRGRVEQGRYLMALGGLKLACLFVSSSAVDRWGRRPLMMASLGGMAAALLAIAKDFYAPASSEAILVGALALYLASFSMGMGPLGWLIPPELFSTDVRARAVSLTTFVNRLTATFMASSMLSIANWLSWGGYFLLLGVVCGTMLAVMYCFLPETKGRKLEEMTEFFSREEMKH